MKTSLAILASAVSLFAAEPALAQVYAGFGVGPSKIDINCAGTLTCDRTDTGFKLYGGWNLGGPWAAELTYFDWGKANSSAVPPAGGTSDLSTKARGLGLGGAYFVNFAAVQCVARLGIAQNRAKTTTTLNAVVSSGTHNLTAPYWGLGCAYSTAPNAWKLTVEIDFSRIKYTAVDKASVQLLTVGLRF